MKFYVRPTKRQLILGFSYLALEWLILPYALHFITQLLSIYMDSTLFNTITFTINFAALFLIFRSFLKESFFDFWEKPLRNLGYVMGGVVLYYLSSTAYSYLLFAFGWTAPNVNDASIYELLLDSPSLIALSIVVLAPFSEELLYRATLFTPFGERFPFLGYLVSVSVFCFIHVAGYIGLYPARTLLLCALQYVPASLILTFLYDKSENIFVPMLVHTILNSISLLLML